VVLEYIRQNPEQKSLLEKISGASRSLSGSS
jgi:hypothetical protein